MIINVPNSDKDVVTEIRKVPRENKYAKVPVIKPSSVTENHTLSQRSENFLRQIKMLKYLPKNHQVYLKHNHIILQNIVV